MANILYRDTMTPEVRTESSIKGDSLTYGELDTNFKLIDEELVAHSLALSLVPVRQILTATYSNNEDLSAIIPLDNTIPQSTEGVELMTIAVTPKISTSKLIIEFEGTVCSTTDGTMILSLFVDLGVNAVYTAAIDVAANKLRRFKIKALLPSTDTTARTYKLRVGTNATNVIRMNGNLTSGLFGGTTNSILTVTEIL